MSTLIQFLMARTLFAVEAVNGCQSNFAGHSVVSVNGEAGVQISHT